MTQSIKRLQTHQKARSGSGFNDPQHSLFFSRFLLTEKTSLLLNVNTRLFFVEGAAAGGARSVEQDQAGVRGCRLSGAAIRLMLHGRIQQLHT
jgi:hypothetical protein